MSTRLIDHNGRLALWRYEGSIQVSDIPTQQAEHLLGLQLFNLGDVTQPSGCIGWNGWVRVPQALGSKEVFVDSGEWPFATD